MDELRSFLQKNRFFLWSLGAHALIFLILWASNDHKKTINTPFDIEVRESVRSELNQRSAESENRKNLRAKAKRELKKSKNHLAQDNGVRNLNDLPVQRHSDRSEVTEGFSDVSKEGNSNQSYLDRIRSKVEFHKTYPKASRVLKETGLVKVRVKIAKSGHVQKIEVVESSHFKRLDDAAIKAVADASPFDEFPAGVMFAAWSILVPMRFELN